MSRVLQGGADEAQRREPRLVLRLERSLGLGHQPVAHGSVPFTGKVMYAGPRRPASGDGERDGERSTETLGGRGADRPAGAGGRDRHRRAGAGRDRLGRGRGVLQYGDDGLPGDPHRSLLRRPDHHLHLPAHRQRRRQPRGHRDLQSRDALGRARLRAARRGHRALQLSRRRDAGCMAEGARHHRHHRRRHARAHRPHPREGHAQRRHRARALGHGSISTSSPPRPRPGRGCWASTWCRR